ncbi:MAG: hypothetical protein L0G70_06090 [Rubrobacter sp.]|nr:hypothetical protein [Rubrobacter sp.]
MTHELAREPAGEPIREPSLQLPQQPMLPFEDSVPAISSDEPSETEMAPREVWKALPGEMKTEVHRDCLRTMREVIDDGPQ